MRAPRDLASLIDHTVLGPEVTERAIARACDEARAHGFAGVCVRGAWIGLVARLLEGSGSRPIAVAGFPLGTARTEEKAQEAAAAVAAGAREIDVVLNVPLLKAKDYALVEQDLRAVVDAARPAAVKVILETAALTRDEKIVAAALAQAAGAAFVKTSTGFGPGGATVEDVALLRSAVAAFMGVKASGGIRTTRAALAMLEAGATRLGCSSSIAILEGLGPAKER